MSEAPAKSDLRSWMESRKGAHVLESLSRKIARRLLASRSPLPFEDVPVGSHPRLEETTPIVLSELTTFVLGAEGRLGRFLAAVPEDQWGRVLNRAFANHLKDLSRKKEGDPFRHLYRRAADLLRKAPGFHFTPVPVGGTTVALASDAHTVGPVTEEDLCDVPVTPAVRDHIPPDGAIASSDMVWLAEHFLKELALQWEQPSVRVPLQHFVQWLYRLLPPRERPVRLGDLHPQQEERGPFEESPLPDPDGIPQERFFDKKKVSLWAGQASGCLKPEEARIVLLHYGEGLTLAKAARCMGKKGASGGAYHLKQVKRRLKSFLRERPWLSPEDLNPEAFSFFWEELLKNLKKRFPAPLSQAEETHPR